MTRCHVWHDFTQTPGICAINHWYNSKEIQAVLTSLLQKRPTKETYILIGTTFKRSRQCEHLLAVWISLLQKRPTKETYKRDLQKRPTKETYILIGRTSKRCSHCINCSVHTAQIFMSLLEKYPTIDSYPTIYMNFYVSADIKYPTKTRVTYDTVSWMSLFCKRNLQKRPIFLHVAQRAIAVLSSPSFVFLRDMTLFKCDMALIPLNDSKTWLLFSFLRDMTDFECDMTLIP